jgi:hypothetical protein
MLKLLFTIGELYSETLHPLLKMAEMRYLTIPFK